MTRVISAHAPQLLAQLGVGPDHAATLLIAAGDNPRPADQRRLLRRAVRRQPVEASSGKTTRRRLNRGGNRHANSALYRIALTRLRHDPRTRAYLDRRTTEGTTRREAIRCLITAGERHRRAVRRQPPPATPWPCRWGDRRG